MEKIGNEPLLNGSDEAVAAEHVSPALRRSWTRWLPILMVVILIEGIHLFLFLVWYGAHNPCLSPTSSGLDGCEFSSSILSNDAYEEVPNSLQIESIQFYKSVSE